jgi:hypothetical protein
VRKKCAGTVFQLFPIAEIVRFCLDNLTNMRWSALSHGGHATPEIDRPIYQSTTGARPSVRVPQTAMQRHFVEVCRGAARPETAYERLYLEWRALEQTRLKLKAQDRVRQREIRSNRSTGIPSVPPKLVPGRWSDPKPYARFIAEPLGTREDFRRDSGANFASSRRNKL